MKKAFTILATVMMTTSVAFSQQATFTWTAGYPLADKDNVSWTDYGILNPTLTIDKISGVKNVIMYFRSIDYFSNGEEAQALGRWHIPLANIDDFEDMKDPADWTKDTSPILTWGTIKSQLNALGYSATASTARIKDPCVRTLSNGDSYLVAKILEDNGTPLYSILAKTTNGGDSWTILGKPTVNGNPLVKIGGFFRTDESGNSSGVRWHCFSTAWDECESLKYFYSDEATPLTWTAGCKIVTRNTDKQEHKFVTTRVTVQDGYAYLWSGVTERHGDCDVQLDWPTVVNLYRVDISDLGPSAITSDFISYSCNPIFTRGSASHDNESALWSFDVLKVVGNDETFHFCGYEGAGTGQDAESINSKYSRQAAWQSILNGESQYDWAGYNEPNWTYSAVFRAKLCLEDLSELFAVTSSIEGTYRLQNLGTGRYLNINTDNGSTPWMTINESGAAYFNIDQVYADKNYWKISRNTVSRDLNSNLNNAVALWSHSLSSATDPWAVREDHKFHWYATEINTGSDLAIEFQNRYTGYYLEDLNGPQAGPHRNADSQRWILVEVP